MKSYFFLLIFLPLQSTFALAYTASASWKEVSIVSPEFSFKCLIASKVWLISGIWPSSRRFLKKKYIYTESVTGVIFQKFKPKKIVQPKQIFDPWNFSNPKKFLFWRYFNLGLLAFGLINPKKFLILNNISTLKNF